jgi:hypothetical protein
MSHVVKMECEINDLDCLDVAAKQLGLELARGQKNFKWYGRFMNDSPVAEGFTPEDYGHCDHAIKIPGNSAAYEVGVTKNKTGKGFRLLWDSWSGGYGLQAKVGQNGNRLIQEYKVQVAMKDRRKQGYRVTRIEKENGRVVLRATK